ncbi:hypothetical protein ACIBO2_38930 [Nonomuraea sp. NPDC050022]
MKFSAGAESAVLVNVQENPDAASLPAPDTPWCDSRAWLVRG